jgi:hypothetical protein
MIPFRRIQVVIALSAGTILVNAQPLSIRYLEFPTIAPGAVFKMEKLLDPRTGTIKFKRGNDVLSMDDLLDMENVENKARAAKNGRLSDELEAKRSHMGYSEKVTVVLHAKLPSVTYPDKTLNSEKVLIASSETIAGLQPVVGLGLLELRHGLTACEHRDSDVSICEANRAQLDALKMDLDVGEVEAYRKEKTSSVELSTLASSAYNPGSVPSGAGSGVRAATFEYGLTSSFISCLGISATYDASTTMDASDIRHTHAAFKSLVHAAPSATFYHRNSISFDGSGDVNYLINNSIQTVSMSMSRGGTSPHRSTYSEYLTMDDFAYRYPYPVFVNPANNNGYQHEVNWQCYNGISVGNVRHTSESTYEMADCTQAKNPPPVYGGCISGSGSNCAGDREMPYLVVPGIPGSGSDFATTCLGGAGSVGCGTSWSAPVGNGMAADIISADSRMVSWPEKVRATMILTAQNVDGGDWTSSTDGRDGAGVASGSEAVSFAQNHTTVSIGNSAVEKGMMAGSMYASDFSSGAKRFNFAVPNPKPSGKHLRVVLTWDSNPIVGGGVNALSDLDLTVQKNGGTQGSYSWDGNVEVVDVSASSLTAGGSYYIDAIPAINRIPSSGSRTNFFYYAIAWTWVKDHAQ